MKRSSHSHRGDEDQVGGRATRVASEAPAVKIPHDPFNEQVLLAACLSDAAARDRILSRATSALFVGKGHARLFEAVKEAKRRGLALDAQTVRQIAGADVDPRYVQALVKNHPKPPANLGHHLSELAWDAARAKLVEGPLSQLLGELADPTASRERVKALARQIPIALEGHGDRRYVVDADALVASAMADLDERIAGRACYPYGIPGLDSFANGDPRMVPGAKPGQVTLVTGLSGSSKSTIVCRMVLGFVAQKRKVLLGAWEMGPEATIELLAVFALGMSRSRVMRGALTQTERDRVRQKEEEVARYVAFWRFPWGRGKGDRPRYNDEAIDRFHGYIADSGCEVVAIDLLRRGLVDRRLDNEEKAIEDMQVVHEETQTHGVWVHQQRLKDLEKSANKRPTREGVKGTSIYVEAPDTIVGVHMPGIWKKRATSTLELLVLKQRHAPWPYGVEFDWDGDLAELSNPRDFHVDMSGADEEEALTGGFRDGLGRPSPKKKATRVNIDHDEDD